LESFEVESIEELTPKLFPDNQVNQDNQNNDEMTTFDEVENTESNNEIFREELYDKEDFEIPAFLRKQKN